jgi:hypothetical protein
MERDWGIEIASRWKSDVRIRGERGYSRVRPVEKSPEGY